MAVLAAGSKLPDFTLKLATKEGHSDLEFKSVLGHGPVVLAFFPLAFSGTCTKEVCDMRDNLAAFSDVGAKVFGLSADSHFSNHNFAKTQGLSFGLLCDPNRTLIPQIWETATVAGIANVAKRGVMVLGSDGAVKWTSISNDPTVWVGAEEVRKHL